MATLAVRSLHPEKRVLPQAIIGLLVIYCLKNISLLKHPYGAWSICDNDSGIALYQRMGFKEMGRNLKAFKLKDGTYIDEINMIRFLL